MHYYKLQVYEPYDGSKSIMLAHEDKLDDLEFHSKIQKAIDGTIQDHMKRCKVKEANLPCDWEYWYLFGDHSKYRFGFFLREEGFEVIHPTGRVLIENRVILSDDRYKNLQLNKCEKCWREYDSLRDKKCPIICKRIESDNDEK